MYWCLDPWSFTSGLSAAFPLSLSYSILTKKDIDSFNKILKEAFKIYDLENENDADNKNINLNSITTIEYIKLGNSKADFYKIEPLLITSNIEGSVLEALDLNDNKIKTFLINRIISIGEDISKESNEEKNQNEIEVIFDLKDDSVLLKIKECVNAVPANQGINATFSTGSQNQYPPQPNS